MKKQALNPYLPLNEYVADGEPHVFGDRIYIYGSHDKENGEVYCMLDYVSYSAPLNDLSDWRYEGVIYRRDQDPHYDKDVYIWAPDVCRGNDGRYYLYYALSTELELGVAVCDEPAGKYEYLGRVSWPDGKPLLENVPFDPALINDNGRIFMYYGFAPAFPIARMKGIDMPGASVVELEPDMLTVKTGPKIIIPSKKYAAGSEFEGHAFFEACSIRKIGDKYYLIYDTEITNELAYAISDKPDGDFNFGGPVISNCDYEYKGNQICRNNHANNHGGMENVNGKWYIFYHRHTHAHQCSRQGCAEKMFIDENGKIEQVQMTSCGLNDGPLSGDCSYNAAYACNIYSKDGGKSLLYGKYLENEPAVFSENGNYFIKDMSDGSTAVFRFFDLNKTSEITISVRGSKGKVSIFINDEMYQTEIAENPEFTDYAVKISNENSDRSYAEVKLVYNGEGKIDFQSISFN